MGTIMALVIWVVLALVTQAVTGLGFIPAAGAILVVYLFARFGGGAGGAGIGGGLAAFFQTLWRTAKGLVIGAALMLLGLAFAGIQPAGWSALDVTTLLFICIIAVVGGIAAQAATGNGRTAMVLFVGAGMLLFVMKNMPVSRGRMTSIPAAVALVDTAIAKGDVVRPVVKWGYERVLPKIPPEGIFPATWKWISQIGWGGRPLNIWKRNTYTVVPPPAPVVPARPKVRALVTPIAIEIDYEFSIEADGPVMVLYPGEDDPVLFDPRIGGCQRLPEPRKSGLFAFWDPNDPDNGKVGFRIREEPMC